MASFMLSGENPVAPNHSQLVFSRLMPKLVEERTGANSQNQFYTLNPKVDDIPDTYGKVCNGVKLLVLGTVETGGGGCVCPELGGECPDVCHHQCAR